MTSYGVCCFRFQKGQEREVLILRRRYTYAYCSIMYGNYKTFHALVGLLAMTMVDEKMTLMTCDFQTIWRRVFVGDDLTSDKYHRAKGIFTDMISSVTRDVFIGAIRNATSIHAPWELPKGRRDSYETEIECACREFCEETSLPRESFSISITDDVKCFFRDEESLYHVKFWCGILRDPTAVPMIRLNDESYREHDAAIFMPMTVAIELVPPPFARVIKNLSPIAKNMAVTSSC